MTERIRDRVEVRGLELLVFCGVLPEEQARRQPFLFDLDLYLDLTAASTSDNLSDTANYGDIIDMLAAKLTDERFQLLERMAARISELIFDSVDVDEVTVTARKLRPPVAAHVDTTGVRIHRVRP
ncbi:MAG: dihydroneopterin aldolase [Actinomycetota bacterium]